MPDDGFEEDVTDRTPKAGFFTVAPVLATVEFGGPQEGGWWVDCYYPEIDPDMPTPEIHTTEEAAYEAAKRMEPLLAEHNKGRYEKSSAASSGYYEIYVFDGYPKKIPEIWPHYE